MAFSLDNNNSTLNLSCHDGRHGSSSSTLANNISLQNSSQTASKNKKLFPQKLWDLINDNRFNFCLRWSEDGQSVYLNRDDFEDFYLKTDENQFNTQKAISFVRQMNMYGFRKVDDCYYENDNFKRGCEHLLKNMIRKHPIKNNANCSVGLNSSSSSSSSSSLIKALTSLQTDRINSLGSDTGHDSKCNFSQDSDTSGSFLIYRNQQPPNTTISTSLLQQPQAPAVGAATSLLVPTKHQYDKPMKLTKKSGKKQALSTTAAPSPPMTPLQADLTQLQNLYNMHHLSAQTQLHSQQQQQPQQANAALDINRLSNLQQFYNQMSLFICALLYNSR